MPDRTRDDELRALIEQYEACEGYRIRGAILEFGRGYEIFVRNHSQLSTALDRGRDPKTWQLLWDDRYKYKREQFDAEIARLLLNFVAAAKALVDNTRNFMDGYSGTEFRKEYQARVDTEFVPDPLVQFIHYLRNYMLHKSFFAASLIKIESQGLVYKSYVALMPDRLQEWDEWNSTARRYLDTLDDQTNLQEVINLYRNKVMQTWKWYGPWLGQVHYEALSEMARLEDRIRGVDPNWVSGYGASYTAKGSSEGP
jgi:hypothetical protein